jgi:hypothetical protein
MNLRNIPNRFRVRFCQSSFAKIGNKEKYKLGSEKWLQAAELQFGGYVRGVKQNIVSESDSRSTEDIQSGMTGGDRMFFHNYGKHYSKHLNDFVILDPSKLVIAEIGILNGSGLAIWDSLFPGSTLIGFDIDISHTQSNLGNLKHLKAFSEREPELFVFDQFKDNESHLKSILMGRKIDVVIDDGEHSDHAILKSFESFRPFLAEKFVYFIEDNRTVHKKLNLLNTPYSIHSYDLLTVIETKS